MRESKNINAIFLYNMQSFPPEKKEKKEEKKREKKKKKKKNFFEKRSYFFLFLKQFFQIKKKEEKSRRPQKRKRAGTLNMYFFFYFALGRSFCHPIKTWGSPSFTRIFSFWFCSHFTLNFVKPTLFSFGYDYYSSARMVAPQFNHQITLLLKCPLTHN